MITYRMRLKRILNQVLESHDRLAGMGDRPGDLPLLKRELLGINGLLKVAAGADPSKIQLSDFARLQPKFREYLGGYYFEKEIDTVMEIYSDDAHRIKNIRLKMLEALGENRMIDGIREMVVDL